MKSSFTSAAKTSAKTALGTLKSNRIFRPNVALAIWASLMVDTANAQNSRGDGIFGSVSRMGCDILRPLVGGQASLLSLVFVILTAVAIFLWWTNENKEGMLIWVIKTVAVVGILINIFALPGLLGMQPVCGGS